MAVSSSSRHSRLRAPITLVAGAVVGALVLAGCDSTENADLDRGRALFQQKCGTCHALAQAGTAANIGPDLDASFAQARADGMDGDTVEGVVQQQINAPREVDEADPDYSKVFMPADLVTGQDAEDVAAYVASVAGVPGAKPPDLPPDQLFVEQCGSCHILAAAGTQGNTGPNLDEVLPGKNEAYVSTQIVEPNSEITPGYQEGIMPETFGTSLTPDQLDELVKYLIDNAGS